MPEEIDILGGSLFNPEEGVQTIYGGLFSYGDITTSGSIITGNTGSLPGGGDYNIPVGSLVTLVLEGESTGSLYFYNGTTWKQIQFVP